jgi:adenylosuccinate synthase
LGDGGWFDVGYVLMLLPAHFAADGVAEDGKKYAFHLLPCGMIHKAGWCESLKTQQIVRSRD